MRRALPAFRFAVVLGSVTALTAPARGAEPAQEVWSAASLLARLADVSAFATPLADGARLEQWSSHDRNGGNGDGGAFFTAAGDAPTTAGYVRYEGSELVIADERRPGCLVRQYYAGALPAPGGLQAFGRLRFFLDGAAAPALDVLASDLVAGQVPGFPRPLVGDATLSSGGNYVYAPICFARSLEVRATGAGLPDTSFYQLGVLVAPPGVAVETSLPTAADAANAAAAFDDAGTAPAAPATATGQRHISFAGQGTIRYLRFSLTPLTEASLSGAQLRITADGAAAPQIDVPLGDALGFGSRPRALRAIGFGAAPEAGTGYFALPIPFDAGVDVEVVGGDPGLAVGIEAWHSSAVSTARLYGETVIETAASYSGVDYRVLDAVGSGWLASRMFEALGDAGTGVQGAQFFLEGDERITIDGNRSPFVYGTGTEESFNGGFYYVNGAFGLPTHGVGPVVPIGEEMRGSIAQYRVFPLDGYRWSSRIAFGAEHGGNDEQVEDVRNTTFSYRRPTALVAADALEFGDATSELAHQLTGSFERRTLRAFFEGERDGSIPAPLAAGGRQTPSVPADLSDEAVSADGIAFSEPVTLHLAVPPSHAGIVLRRLFDAEMAEASDLRVRVGGQDVTGWYVARSNPYKRWLEVDLELPLAAIAGHDQLDVTLVPAAGHAETAFGISALARPLPEPGAHALLTGIALVAVLSWRERTSRPGSPPGTPR
jgi:hypothetical protein